MVLQIWLKETCECISFTKLLVSYNLSRSTITNQIAFDQRDLHLISRIQKCNGPSLPGTGFQIGNLRYHHFYLTGLWYNTGWTSALMFVWANLVDQLLLLRQHQRRMNVRRTYLYQGGEVTAKISWKCSSLLLVRKVPLANLNSGPGEFPWHCRKNRIADTAHMGVFAGAISSTLALSKRINLWHLNLYI